MSPVLRLSAVLAFKGHPLIDLIHCCLHAVVQLALNESERQKYNEIVSQIKTNLIASRCAGPDSFLHPGNRKYAQRALTNLILYCFHFTSLDREQRELWYARRTGPCFTLIWLLAVVTENTFYGQP
jgi:hypothetical protein